MAELVPRLMLGTMVGACALYVLARLVEPVPQPERPSEPGPALRAEDEAVLAALRGQAREIVVCGRAAPAPAGVDPILDLLPGGGIRVQRAGAATVPATGTRQGGRVGVRLPVRGLSDLEPQMRAALLQVLELLAAPGGQGAAITWSGVRAEAGEVRRLLRWRRGSA